MFTYYLVTGIITLALIALCAFAMADKTKARQLINNLQKALQELEDKLDKAEKKASELKKRYDQSVKLFEEMRTLRDGLKRRNQELENLTLNCAEIEKSMREEIDFKDNRIKTLEDKIAKLSGELKAKEQQEVKVEVEETTQVVQEEVKAETTSEEKPKKVKRPYKRNQKKQN